MLTWNPRRPQEYHWSCILLFPRGVLKNHTCIYFASSVLFSGDVWAKCVSVYTECTTVVILGTDHRTHMLFYWTSTGPRCRLAVWPERSWRRWDLSRLVSSYTRSGEFFSVPPPHPPPPLLWCHNSTDHVCVGVSQQVSQVNNGGRASPGHLLSADWGEAVWARHSCSEPWRQPAAQVWGQEGSIGGQSPVPEVRLRFLSILIWCIGDMHCKTCRVS